MRETVLVDADSAGVMLFDPSAVVGMAPSLVERINVALDPDGRTCAIYDYPDREWSSVWQEAIDWLSGMPAAEAFAMCLTAEGLIAVRVQDGGLALAEQNRVSETFTTSLRIAGSSLAVTSGMEFFEDDLADVTVIYGRTLEVDPGEYQVDIHPLKRPEDGIPIVGQFWTLADPAIIIRLTPAPSHTEHRRNAFRLNTADWPTDHCSGFGTAAVVNRIQLGQVHCRLKLTSHASSGRARFANPPDRRLQVGDIVWLQLRDDLGKYWTADLLPENAELVVEMD